MIWPRPKSRNLSASSDLKLFYESLKIFQRLGIASKKELSEELSDRVKGIVHIKELSKTAIDKLFSELKLFNWIDFYINAEVGEYDKDRYALTLSGMVAVEEYESNNRLFLNKLIQKMQSEYVIPGWFIDRLWRLNPKGQGQIIIPSPMKSWEPKSRKNTDCNWSDELKIQSQNTVETIRKVLPGSFRIKNDFWINSVEQAWNRLSKQKIRKENSRDSYSPRLRLNLAMREAAINLMFHNTLYGEKKPDIDFKKQPLQPRSYMAWCPRLDELELIFYSDFNSKIPGRIIFPVSVYKGNEDFVDNNYEHILDIRNRELKELYLYRPIWNQQFERLFSKTIYEESQRLYNKTKALYVSAQDLRDETCRILRISSSYFNECLEKVFDLSLLPNSEYTISLETDIREDQRSAFQRLRRAVLVKNKLISLVAITRTILRK